MDTELAFCIFSFNRGKFLENCISSIEASGTAPRLYIFDDDSTDHETANVLDKLGEKYEVLRPLKKSGHKHGGLYHNMQRALELLHEFDLICFLQDDTQVVRPIFGSDIDAIRGVLRDNPTLAFVHPCFVRGSDEHKRPCYPEPMNDEKFFLRNDLGQSAGVYYSDLVVFSPKRLLESGWRFVDSEPANECQAKELFMGMAYMCAPFAMWLPEVPAYRGKSKTLGLRLAERARHCGFYPYKIWSQVEAERFTNRSERSLPVAEEFLSCSPEPPFKPWTYNPLSSHKLYKLLNSLELATTRLMRFLRERSRG